MVILESLACATPVVAFGLGAMNDLIVDDVRTASNWTMKIVPLCWSF